MFLFQYSDIYIQIVYVKPWTKLNYKEKLEIIKKSIRPQNWSMTTETHETWTKQTNTQYTDIFEVQIENFRLINIEQNWITTIELPFVESDEYLSVYTLIVNLVAKNQEVPNEKNIQITEQRRWEF